MLYLFVDFLRTWDDSMKWQWSQKNFVLRCWAKTINWNECCAIRHAWFVSATLKKPRRSSFLSVRIRSTVSVSVRGFTCKSLVRVVVKSLGIRRRNSGIKSCCRYVQRISFKRKDSFQLFLLLHYLQTRIEFEGTTKND